MSKKPAPPKSKKQPEPAPKPPQKKGVPFVEQVDPGDITAEDIAKEREQKRRDSLDRLKRVPPLFYSASGSYWFKPNNRFLEMSEATIKRHLKHNRIGLRDDTYFDGIKEIEWPFFNVEQSTDKVVDYAGSLAGHRTGIYHNQGKNYLVTEEPPGVWDDLPAPAEPPLFAPFIRALLPGEQWRMMCFWLAIALRSLRNFDFKAGQMVWLCGPRNCGKSLLIYFVKLILGGREANPFYYLSGATDFNYDCMGAEVWSFEDPPSRSDYHSRCEFGERLKELVNNDTIRAHRKNKDSLLLRVFRRLIAAINSKQEHIQRIPPMIEGTADKNFVFKCEDARGTLARFIVTKEQAILPGMGESVPVGQQDRNALRMAAIAEIPLIQAWLLHEFKNVPADWLEDRMGIKAWQHPELMAAINDLSPEAHLMCLIDQYCWDQNDKLQPPITGSAHEIYVQLRDQTKGEVSSICKNAITLGRYLSKCRDLYEGRISERTKSGRTLWTITPPQDIEELATESELNEERL